MSVGAGWPMQAEGSAPGGGGGADPAMVMAKVGIVSRETLGRLERYVDLLLKWQKSLNLIGRGTMDDIWLRHIADSAQLLRHAPDGGHWLDLGSGAGLPGLIVAICSDRPVTLVESDTRKCAFIREAARATGTKVEIRNCRIETLENPGPGDPVQVVSARALAPLPELLRLSAPFLMAGAIGLFQKGGRWREELTAAEESWIVQATPSGSLTHPDSVVLRISNLAPRPSAPPDRTGVGTGR